MKIIELHFKNINSLKGEHRISFEEVPLSNASIFAIVGPTGSGKSTILDVITLALFNRIPRFSKPLSTNEITKESSVVTHHTKEAFVAIEYEIKGKRYKSKWSIDTNRNDKFRDYEMTFYNPDGSVADLKKKEVPERNEEVIGLNYDQFVKAILLSQGEFSKFLKSDKNERGALLENLTGTGIYRKIGRKTYDKYRDVKQALEREQALLGEHTLLDEDERTRLEFDINSAETSKQSIDKALVSLNRLLQIKERIISQSNALVIKEKEVVEISQLVVAFESSAARIKTHQKVSHLHGRFTTYSDAKANATKSKENVIEYKLQLKESKKQLQLAIDEMATLTHRDVTQENFKKEMSAFEKAINDLDKDIEHLKQSGHDTRNRINNDKENYPIRIDNNAKVTEALDLLAQRSKKLKVTIANASLDSNQSLADLREGLKKTQGELDQLKVLDQHFDKISTLEKTLKNEAEELKTYQADEAKYLPLLDINQKLVESKEAQITLLLKQKEDALKIAKLEDLRDALVSGEACPLCGSLDHPYTSHLPSSGQSEIENQIQKIETEVKESQQKLKEYNRIVDQSKASILLKQKTIKDGTEILTEENTVSQQLLSTLDKAKKIDVGSIKQLIEEQSVSLEQRGQAMEAVAEVEHNDRLSDQYTTLHAIGVKYQNLHKERQNKFTGPSISDVANPLQDRFEKSKTKIVGLESVIKQESDSLKRDEDLVNQISKELLPKVKELGFLSLDDIANQLLKESELAGLTKQQESINNATVRVNTEISNIKKDIEEQNKLDNDKNLTVEVLRSTIIDQKTLSENKLRIANTNQAILKRDKEDRGRFQERQKNIDKLTIEFKKWDLLNKMIGSATGNDFANFAQGLTLKNLLVYANRRLENLSDRYLLSMPENDGALIVIDKYQGNTSRSVKTLSGGETFLISLALALSLSDMASKNVALACLFIDEGFGTLDPETLELAMTTLETLQSESQKTVGVISHVATLKERIDVQIQLERNAQGLSSIKVVG